MARRTPATLAEDAASLDRGVTASSGSAGKLRKVRVETVLRKLRWYSSRGERLIKRKNDYVPSSYISSESVPCTGVELEARRLNAMLGQELMQGAALLKKSHATLLTYQKGGGIELQVAPNTTVHLKDARGQDVLIVGDPEEYADFNHAQGERTGYPGECSFVSCQDILLQFGRDVSEIEVVDYAIKHGLCYTKGDPDKRGGTNILQQVQILMDYGIPAHYEVWATSRSYRFTFNKDVA